MIKKLEELLSKRYEDKSVVEAILNVFSAHKRGDWLSGKDVSQVCHLPVKEIYTLYHDLEKDYGFLKIRFQTVCPVCGEIIGNYNALTDVPKETECPRCNVSFKNTLESIYPAFEMMVDFLKIY